MRRRYVFNRIYAAFVLTVWGIGIPTAVYALAVFDRAEGYFLTLLFVPFFIPALIMMLGCGAYKLPYSAFGSKDRTELPNEGELLVESQSWIVMKHFRWSWPGVTWRVFPSGIGVSIELIGEMFLPKERIRSVARDWHGRCWIEHDFPEFRSPIVAPSVIGDAMLKHFGIC